MRENEPNLWRLEVERMSLHWWNIRATAPEMSLLVAAVIAKKERNAAIQTQRRVEGAGKERSRKAATGGKS